MFAEAKHLERLIEDLRILALADAGELPLSKENVQISKLLNHVKLAFAQQAKACKIEIEVEQDVHLPSPNIDPGRMKQVLNNLVRNALRYTPAGGRITLAAHARGEKLQIQIQDTGRGIPAASLPHIFDRFYKVDTSRTDHLETSGLGLAIVQSIVAAHQGEIMVTSEVDVGTTFSILLPLPQ